ncbi:MAG: chaperone NapD [Pseudomonadota bacterium]
MNSIDICGVLIHARPEKLQSTRKALAAMPGVEVHGANEDGRLVVTIEEVSGEKLITKTMTDFNEVDGVLSTSLIYQHSEPAGGEAAR